MCLIAKLLITLALIQLSQGFIRTFKYDKRRTNDGMHPWLVTIRQENGTKTDLLGYGSLFLLNAVLTSAENIASYSERDLIVETSYQLNTNDKSLDQCISSTVSKIIYESNQIDATDFGQYYAILILKNSLHHDHIDSINIASRNNLFNKKNCFITSWMVASDTKDADKKELVQTSHKASVLEGSLYLINLWPSNTESLRQEQNNTSDNLTSPQFSGSPLICSLKSNPEQYIQVGVATVELKQNVSSEYVTLDVKNERVGYYLTVVSRRREIMEKFNQNIFTEVPQLFDKK